LQDLVVTHAIDLYVVNVPQSTFLRDDYYRTMYPEYERLLRDVVGDTSYLDLARFLRDDEFHDMTHPNLAAARRTSRRVAQFVKETDAERHSRPQQPPQSPSLDVSGRSGSAPLAVSLPTISEMISAESGPRSLFRYARPFLHLIAIATVASVGARALVLVLPQFASRIIDTAQGQLPPSLLSTTGALLMGALLLAALLQFTGAVLFAFVGERVVQNLRYDLFSHLLSLSMSFFERRRVGEMISRVAADATTIRELATSLPQLVVNHGVIAIGAVTIIMIRHPKLTLIMLAFLPFIALSGAIVGRRVRRMATRAQDDLAQTNVGLEEALSGIATVKAFAQEETETARYMTRLSTLFRSSLRVFVAQEAMRLLSLLLVYGGLVTVTWYATTQILAGVLTTGELVAFLMYAMFAGNSFRSLVDVWSRYERMRGITLRLVQIFLERPSVVDRPDAVVFDGSHRRIAFHHVSFSYPSDPDRRVLVDLDFSVHRGEHIALVGESGAGKSTIASLLLRLHDVTGGSITIDGRDIRELLQQDLRRAIAVVPQDIAVFGRSVRENVAYGRRDVTDAEIVAAARAANALEFIERLPHGFDTVLGVRGVTLSGGQRQRLAIARAIIKNPAILILDEATSALDKPSEALVRDALTNLMKGRTTIVIAHRLATIEGADRVLVLREGRLVESGTPDDLRRAGGHYAWLHQTGAWEGGPAA
jgi:ABC-type multidrug transport system fused ATPase/permease subunit